MKKTKLWSIVFVAFMILSAVQGTAFAFPSESTDKTADAAITIDRNVMNIVGKNQNNVINWKSFDIGENETIQFDGDKCYLNLIHDNNTSEIFGKIQGNGNVYIINPNAVYMGRNSSISLGTGSLYISTCAISDVNITSYLSGSDPLPSPPNPLGDILHLGSVSASFVSFVGSRVLLTDKLNVDSMRLSAKGNVEVGHVYENDADSVNDKQFASDNLSELMNQFNIKNNAKYFDLNGNSTEPKAYWIVRNVIELQNMKNNLQANYILVNDIDASDTLHWDASGGFVPIGTGSPFLGSFDGLDYKITNLHISNTSSGALFENIGSIGNVVNIDIPHANSFADSLYSMWHDAQKLYATAPGKAMLFIADYNSDGALTSVKKYDISPGIINAEYDFAEGQKAFLWSEDLKPLCESEAY